MAKVASRYLGRMQKANQCASVLLRREWMHRKNVVTSGRGVVLDSNWNESNVNLNRNNPDNSNENLGARRSIRDFGLP